MNTNDKRIEVLTRADQRDAKRYRKVEAWMARSLTFHPADECWHDSVQICGPTFDEAVDALPEPEEK